MYTDCCFVLFVDKASESISLSLATKRTFQSILNSFPVSSCTNIPLSAVDMYSREDLYQPLHLSRREIRLVEIFEHIGENNREDQPVKCKLHTVSMHDNPIFSALSYVWGDPNDTTDIEVVSNGDEFATTEMAVRVPITSNLDQALRHTRGGWKTVSHDIWPENYPIYLWVDALCINQADANERAAQVQLMGVIFKSAAIVLAWLGMDDGTLSLAFSTIEKIASEVKKCDSESPNSFNTLEWMVRHPDLCETGPEVTAWTSNRSWKAVAHLLNHIYWSRVWIFQEQVLAKELKLMTDHGTLSWQDLHIVVKRLQEMRATINQFSAPRPDWVPDDAWIPLTTPYLPLNNVENISRFRDLPWLSKEPSIEANADNLSARWELSFFCAITYRATDPRDHIYGVLGLTKLDFNPDYSSAKTAGDVFSEWAVGYIEANRHMPRAFDEFHPLIFLGHAGIGLFGVTEGLPSWVPNFVKHAERQSSSTRVSTCSMADNKLFTFDNSYAFVRNSALFVLGIEIGSVQTISEAPSQDARRDGRMLTFIRDFLLSHPTYVSGMPSLQAFFRLAMRDSSSQVTSLTVLRALAFLNFLCTEPQGISIDDGLGYLGFHIRTDPMPTEPGDLLEVRQSFENWFTSSIFPDLDLSSLDLNLNLLNQFLLGREGRLSEVWSRVRLNVIKLQVSWRFIETQNGFLGIAPAGTRPGDKLCILKDCGVPVILRPHESHYIHIGTSFVVGLMNGDNSQYSWAREAGRNIFQIR